MVRTCFSLGSVLNVQFDALSVTILALLNTQMEVETDPNPWLRDADICMNLKTSSVFGNSNGRNIQPHLTHRVTQSTHF